MQTDKSPKTLILTAVDPTQGTGTVALNFFKALKRNGQDVDLLTKYPVKGHPEFLYVLPVIEGEPKNNEEQIIIEQNTHSVQTGCQIPQQGNHAFDYAYEDEPPVDPSFVLDSIKRPYDIIYIVFWYQLISYKTIRAIYDKLHCQIHFRCPDNQPIAGGCHFIGNCPRVSDGCGFCPGLINGEANDFTKRNVQYRKKVLRHVRPIVYGNTHMQMIYKQTYLFREYKRLETVYPLVDNEFFHPIDKLSARQQYGINPNKKFILFFGCTILSEERKGMRFLLEALNMFHDQLTEKQRKEVLLIVAGNFAEPVISKLPFEYKYIGYVPMDQLPVIYSMANAFLCPSIDDAGPSMVNQSLSCGTPVIAFQIGTALDMVMNHNTGYCAELYDAKDYAHGILHIYNRTVDEFDEICHNCRKIALERTTDESFVKEFLRIYDKYKQRNRIKLFLRRIWEFFV
jgi:glycosyltransferase involved in cell wall biosynthesis